ncbi:MAG: hypothetical protein RR646_00035 [Erysipelotrichaceae bacterium]
MTRHAYTKYLLAYSSIELSAYLLIDSLILMKLKGIIKLLAILLSISLILYSYKALKALALKDNRILNISLLSTIILLFNTFIIQVFINNLIYISIVLLVISTTMLSSKYRYKYTKRSRKKN